MGGGELVAIIHTSGAFGPAYKNTGLGGVLAKRRLPGQVSTGPSPWTPPTSAPPGTYDPNIDFNSETNNQDYATTQQGIGTSYGRSLQDYTTAFNRAQQTHLAHLGALGQALSRANQDYGTNTQTLGTNYANLGVAQGEKARAAGVASGGALQQALQKRTANQATDQGKLDQAITRFREDNTTATTQENQSWQDLVGAGNVTNLDDVMAHPENYGSLGMALGRSLQDLSSGSLTAFNKNALFNDQTNRAKTYEAAQAGLLPTLPAGSYAALPAGQNQWGFAGVQYGPGSVSNPFLTPLTRPTAASVLATGSLKGTDITRRRRPKGY